MEVAQGPIVDPLQTLFNFCLSSLRFFIEIFSRFFIEILVQFSNSPSIIFSLEIRFLRESMQLKKNFWSFYSLKLKLHLHEEDRKTRWLSHFIPFCSFSLLHTRTYTRTYTRTHPRTNTRTHTHTQTRMYVQIQAHPREHTNKVKSALYYFQPPPVCSKAPLQNELGTVIVLFHRKTIFKTYLHHF